MLYNKGSGTTVSEQGAVSLRACQTKGNAMTSIGVFSSGEAHVDRCSFAAEGVNMIDYTAKLRYSTSLSRSEHITLVLVKALAVIMFIALTGSAGGCMTMWRHSVSP